MTVERLVTVSNRHGIHARPAAAIVKEAARYSAHITLARDDLDVNGKSIMGVMMLAAECGSVLTLRAVGDDAEQAVEALSALIAGSFGEA